MSDKLRKSASHPNSIAAAKKILTVASGKGGVGKTWLSASLCHAMAQDGKRVLLFDGDLGLANVDIQLGLNVQHDLVEVVSGKLSMRKAITPYKPGGFFVIAGRSGSGVLADLNRSRIKEMRREILGLANTFDRIVVDLGAGVETAVRGLLPKGCQTYVVTTDEPTSLTDAYAFVKIAMRLDPETDPKIIVNMADSLEKGLRTYETLSRACNSFLSRSPELTGVVRRDSKVRDAIRRQTLYMNRYPTTTATRDIRKIAAKL